MKLGLSVAALVVLVDQLSKYLIKNLVLAEAPVVTMTSFFNLVTAWNTGVSFSMFNDYGLWGVIGLSVLAIGIVGYLLYWMSHEQDKFLDDVTIEQVREKLGEVIPVENDGFELLDRILGL